MKWVVGIDEVGRGPLAGPVYVCAVAMPARAYARAAWRGLNDSKQMTARAREVWHARARTMKKDGAIRIALASRSATSIDKRGINGCINACVRSALQKLALDPACCTVLLDGGLRAPDVYVAQRTIIRGDASHPIISLASVVAKVSRDALMVRLHAAHPQYAWHENKGYGTRKHREIITENGISPVHRASFCHFVR